MKAGIILNFLGEIEENRPSFHIYPDQGLLNDPVGLIQWKGIYHIFYQWNPYATNHSHKCWGHVTSRDLVTWQREKAALIPSEWFDKDGCYSGSSIVYNEQIYLFYTGNVINTDGSKSSYQCLAVSSDGIHFEKKGPIIDHPAGYTRHVRDPKVWQGEDNCYRLLLGAQTENLEGTVLIYTSMNLQQWKFEHKILLEDLNFGYMWECPDLLIDQGKDISAFVFSPQGIPAFGINYHNIFQTGYLLGKFDELKNQFSPTTAFKELDHGFEFYACQSFHDETGRLLLFGWLGVMESELEIGLPSIKENNWAHVLSIPREITIAAGQLKQRPVVELQSLRLDKIFLKTTITEPLNLEQYANEIGIDLNSSVRTNFSMNLYQEIQIDWQENEKLLTVSRTNWITKKREYRSAFIKAGLNKLQIFAEKSVIEIFVNDGSATFSLRCYNEKMQPVVSFLDPSSKIIQAFLYPLNQ